MKPTANPFMQAFIAVALVLFFGAALFLPALLPDFSPNESVLQTLLTLVVVAVGFYLGSSSSSAGKDQAIRDMLPGKPDDQP